MIIPEKSDVIIIGAGIAGLTAALCLARAGFRVALFEKNIALEDIGAGIQLTPNASHILMDLGLEEALNSLSTQPDIIEILSLYDNKSLIEMDLRDLSTRYGAPWLTLKRADLQKILLNAVMQEYDISLHLGRTIELFTQTNTGVIIKCRTPTDILHEYHASILIGADGIWSVVRPFMSDPEPPYFTGYEAWRALLPLSLLSKDDLLNRVRLRLGKGCHLVTYPVSGGKALNIVFIRKASDQRDVAGQKNWSHTGVPYELQSAIASISSDVASLFEKVGNWQVWSLYDMPVATMVKGNTVLIGDAAHPILPFLAQGAALAIEDAAVLTKCLVSSKNDTEPYINGLKKFASTREKRARRLRNSARSNGKVYHLSWPFSAARNMVMKILGAKGMSLKYKWLYGWRS